MHSEEPHRPRGTHDPRPLVRALSEVGIPDAEKIAGNMKLMLGCEAKLTRALELINRRKVHFLTGGV